MVINQIQKRKEEQEEARLAFERQSEHYYVYDPSGPVPVVTFQDIELLKRMGIAW